MADKDKADKCFFFGRKTPPPEKTKDLILEAAKKHFCEKGYDGASVRDICCEVGANVSAIKYHFGGKEGLYRECFIKFGEERLSIATRVLSSAESVEDLKVRLKLFAQEFINLGLADLSSTKLICSEIESLNPMIADIFQNTFLEVYRTLVKLLTTSQEKGYIRKDIDPLLAGSFFFNSITQNLRIDHVAEKFFSKTLKDENYKNEFINNLITVLFDGIKTQEL